MKDQYESLSGFHALKRKSQYVTQQSLSGFHALKKTGSDVTQ